MLVERAGWAGMRDPPAAVLFGIRQGFCAIQKFKVRDRS